MENVENSNQLNENTGEVVYYSAKRSFTGRYVCLVTSSLAGVVLLVGGINKCNYTLVAYGVLCLLLCVCAYYIFIANRPRNDELIITDEGVVWTLNDETNIVRWELIKKWKIENMDSDGVNCYLFITMVDSKDVIDVHIEQYKYKEKTLCIALNKAHDDFKNKAGHSGD